MSKIDDIAKLIHYWKSRKLSLFGKATVIKTLIIPKLNHVLSNLSTPKWFVDAIRDLIFDFLWDGKPPKIKNKVVTNSLEKGGLNIPDMELHTKTQKVAWVKRIISKQDSSWTQFIFTFLPQMTIEDLLRCSIDPCDITADIPNFYRQILVA
jgi:hypothetical protein